jgi:AraC-like DNA-binding protein
VAPSRAIAQNGNPWAWSRIVTQRHCVNSSQLLCEPKRAPFPEAPVPPGVLMGRASLDLLKAALASRDLAERPDTVRLQVDTYLQAHVSDPGLCHRTVAEAFHMSERTLHRLFGGAGQSVTGRIRSYRLDAILADLRSPGSANDSISRVAARWGVHDMPHLVRAFRARYGMTPSEARRHDTVPDQAAKP